VPLTDLVFPPAIVNAEIAGFNSTLEKWQLTAFGLAVADDPVILERANELLAQGHTASDDLISLVLLGMTEGQRCALRERVREKLT
jgi:hypothetical protein